MKPEEKNDNTRKAHLIERLKAYSEKMMIHIENNDLLKAIAMTEVINIALKHEAGIRWTKKQKKDEQLISELLDKIKNGEK